MLEIRYELMSLNKNLENVVTCLNELLTTQTYWKSFLQLLQNLKSWNFKVYFILLGSLLVSNSLEYYILLSYETL